ncbi:MAG: hypothetical protein WD229_19190, partial [Pirellulales bacterium]
TDQFITGTLFGYPVVGDFDGDGNDDLAAFNANTWHFDLANDGLGVTNTAGGADVGGGDRDRTLLWGFPGVLERPLAADIDQDGIDDIGLWVPGADGSATWYFLVSNDPNPADAINDRIVGNINTLNHAFSTAPFGHDLFARFGSSQALPVVGNFDPPSPGVPAPSITLAGDYDGNGRVEPADYDRWRIAFGSTDSTADGNGDQQVNAADYIIWRANLGSATGGGSGSGESTETAAAVVEVESATPASAIAMDAVPTMSDSTDPQEPSSAPLFVETGVAAIGRRERGPSRHHLIESVFAEPTLPDLRLILLSRLTARDGLASPPLPETILDEEHQADGLAHDLALQIAWDDLG